MSASTSNAPSRSATEDREITISRLFDAPRDLVFQMWTDPAHVGKWWGPRGFTTTTERIDIRPGGEWKFIMHGPDGRNYDSHIAYTDITRPERIVYQQNGDKKEAPFQFTNTITFEDVGGQTRLTMRLLFTTAESRNRVIKEFGAIEGGNQTLDRFAEHMVSSACKTSPNAFAIARIVNAPRDLVFKVWTEKEHLGQWFGPKGWTTSYRSFDFRPGGKSHYSMKNDQGHEMWGLWTIREITPPQRLVFVSSFADAQGNITRAPFPQLGDKWPLETLTTVSFVDYQGRTLVTIQSVPINASQVENDTFSGMNDSMTNGWSGTFDQLVEYLRNV